MIVIAEDSVRIAHSGPSHNLLSPAIAEIVSCGPLPLPVSGGGHASAITTILPPATKSWEGCSRNLFRRNRAKLTLPPLSSYPYKYERRRLNLLVAFFPLYPRTVSVND